MNLDGYLVSVRVEIGWRLHEITPIYPGTVRLEIATDGMWIGYMRSFVLWVCISELGNMS